jgi:hypothetical protein
VKGDCKFDIVYDDGASEDDVLEYNQVLVDPTRHNESEVPRNLKSTWKTKSR